MVVESFEIKNTSLVNLTFPTAEQLGKHRLEKQAKTRE